MPQQGVNQSSYYGGQVPGAKSDQNSIVLDGGNLTSSVSGNSDYYTNYTGGQQAPIPTPVESIQEFRVATTNHTASFTGSSGSQTVLVTKRGSSQFHGSLYEYLQNDQLNANRWDLNPIPQARPESRDNRFGATLGGYIPGLPEKAKTFFFVNYEGRRMLNTATVSRLVPTDTMKQGVLRFRDATGNIIAYNLATSTQCGPKWQLALRPAPRRTESADQPNLEPVRAGRQQPEPRGWPQHDRLNRTGRAAGDGQLRRDSAGPPIRIQLAIHQQLSSLHRDGGRGQPAGGHRRPAARRHQADRVDFQHSAPAAVFRGGLTGVVTPSLTSETSVSYLRDWWYWKTAGSFPQVLGTTGSLMVGGDNDNELVPITYPTGTARQRAWNSHSRGFVRICPGEKALIRSGLAPPTITRKSTSGGTTGRVR